MLDLRGAHVEVTTDGVTLWVNIDSVCALRVTDPKLLIIDDKRDKQTKELQSELAEPPEDLTDPMDFQNYRR